MFDGWHAILIGHLLHPRWHPNRRQARTGLKDRQFGTRGNRTGDQPLSLFIARFSPVRIRRILRRLDGHGGANPPTLSAQRWFCRCQLTAQPLARSDIGPLGAVRSTLACHAVYTLTTLYRDTLDPNLHHALGRPNAYRLGGRHHGHSPVVALWSLVAGLLDIRRTDMCRGTSALKKLNCRHIPARYYSIHSPTLTAVYHTLVQEPPGRSGRPVQNAG